MNDNYAYSEALYKRRLKIATRIQGERKRHNMSQEELADRLSALLGCDDIAQNTISGWERGKNLPPLDKIFALSQIFECDCGYLLCDYDEKTHGLNDICQSTGLSELSVQTLCSLNEWGLAGDITRILDLLILDSRYRAADHDYRAVLHLLLFFFNFSGKDVEAKQVNVRGEIIDTKSSAHGGYLLNSIRITDRIVENAVLMEIQQALIGLKSRMQGEKDG